MNGSLGLVNRYLATELMTFDDMRVQALPVERDAMPDTWFKNSEILRASYRNDVPEAKIHIRQQWPPNFSDFKAPCNVMFQPWEYGTIPKDWIQPIQDYVDEVWVNSEHTKQGYVKSGILESEVFVFPLGFDPEVYHPHGPRMALKTNKTFKFLFVGGAIFRKGIDKLLEAYVKTFSASDDVCLVIKDHGFDSHYKGQTKTDDIKAVQSRKECPEILYLDEEMSPYQLAALYRTCDCLVHPYRGEGFGLPILEAMACGIPPIIPSIGPATEFSTPGTSFRVPAHYEYTTASDLDTLEPLQLISVDVDVLGQTMRRVVENQGSALEKGRSAADYTLANYTWKAVSTRVHERVLHLSERRSYKRKPQNSVKQVYRRIAHQFEGVQSVREQLYSPLVKCFSPGDKVIDLGAGDGTFLKLLRNSGIEGIGVDLDPAKVEEMRANGLNVVHADVVKYAETLSSSLDGLSMLHIVEHMNSEQAIGMIYEVSRHFSYRGRIVIVTPNFENPAVAQRNFWLDVTHIRPYPIELLNALLQAIGFRTIVSGKMNADMDTVVFGSMLANDNPFA